uniref:Lr14a n=1 Tax=Triticum aestivum TaxID=4565 RepID=A0A7S6HA22_WHEAT|nr:Lr14a [Triticum aestivum]
MDAKLMVATDCSDVKRLKDLLNKEDAMAMVVVTATSNEPAREDQPPAGNIINPLLLASARVGSWEALNFLLVREDAKENLMMIPNQIFLELLARGRSTQGRIAVSVAHDVEEGVDHQPAASLPAGALLKGITPDGDTALHAVASSGDGPDFLKYASIINRKDKVLLFAKNHNDDTPLHCAARAGNSNMVSHLIALAAEMKLDLLRAENKRHETALHDAIRFEDGTILGEKDRALLITPPPAREENINRDNTGGVQNDDGINPGGAQEEKNIVKLLVGADPELANYPEDGISPLYLAILLEKSTIARTLYDMSGGNLSYSGADGQNALHVAVLRDRDTVMVDFLVHWNKSLTTEVDKYGSTPLHFASSMYFWTGSYVRLEPLHGSPWCHFVWFPWISTRNLKKVFKANCAALYQADKNGSFPIHVAASVGARDAIQSFHDECPGSVGLRDAKGRTFLHVAIDKQCLGIVFYVCGTPSLAYILNMQDNDGNTALHLAIKARSFRMFCALLGNLEVNLNLTNNHGQTPRDLSRYKLPRGMSYASNSENKIYSALSSVGANHGAFRWDKAGETYIRITGPEDKDKESERLRNAAQALIVASVLIATVAFTSTFALPGGYRTDNHAYEGSPIHAGSYVFDAFMMAITLSFICSSVATIGFVFSATPMVSLFTRRANFNVSVFSMWSAVTCLSLAFALGVYMVLAPVARSTAVAVCVITPAVLLSANMEFIMKFFILAPPLCTRIGLYLAMVKLVKMHIFIGISALWPFIVTFGWAALARIHRNR